MSDNVIDITIRADDQSGSAWDSAKSSAKGFGSAVEGVFQGIGQFAGAQMMGMASKVADAFGEALNIDAAQDKLAAQLGLTAQQSEAFGKTAGELYAGAYGESLDEVNDALRYVQQNIGDGIGNSENALKSATGSVLDLSAAFGEDLGPVTRAVGTMIKSGLVKDAQEGLDILTVGLQNGTNAGEDLLDTFSEYSTQFRELGISAEMGLGLMSQGMKAGARDSDTLADAIKEFAIRSKDGSKASAEGFAAIGMNAQKMTAIFAKGGPEAEAAMTKVIQALKSMKDPVAQDAAAVALFGTKAEDLGNALYALDPTTAVASLGEVEGAAQRMGNTLADNAATKIEAFKRTIQQGIVNFLKDTVLPQVVATVESLAPAFGRIQEIAGQVAAGVKDAWQLLTQGTVSDELTTNLGALGEPIKQITDRVRELAAEWLPRLQEAWTNVSSSLAGFWSAIQGNENLLITLGIILGGVLLVGVYSLVTAFASLAVAVIAATWPFIAVAAAIFALVTGLRYAYDNWEWFRTGVDAVVQWLVTNVPPVFEIVRAAVATAIEWIVNVAVPFITNAFGSFVGFLQNTLMPAVQVVWAAVVEAVSNAVNFIRPIIDFLVQIIQDNFGHIAQIAMNQIDVIRNVIANGWQIISNIFQFFLNIISGNWGAAWNNICNILSAVWNTIQNVISNGANTAREILQGLANSIGMILGRAAEGALNAGRAIIENLWNGFASRVDWVKSKMASALGPIAGLFPHSPAKEGPFSGRGWTKYSGQSIAEDFAAGVRSRMSAVNSAANMVVGGMAKPFDSSPATAAAPLAAAGATINVYVAGSIQSERDFVKVIRNEFVNLGFAS